jgi:hypothetical protein
MGVANLSRKLVLASLESQYVLGSEMQRLSNHRHRAILMAHLPSSNLDAIARPG